MLPVAAKGSIDRPLAPFGFGMRKAGRIATTKLFPWRVVGMAKGLGSLTPWHGKDGQAGARRQAGEARIADVIRKGDFSRCTCVVKTPFNMILEARP